MKIILIVLTDRSLIKPLYLVNKPRLKFIESVFNKSIFTSLF